MDAAIRYSPHSTPSQQRFLILKPAQHRLHFYQIDQVRGQTVDYHQLSQHTDFSSVRAFDWSPSEESIVAVGLTTGEAALLRIDDSSNGLLSFNFKNPRPCNAIALSVNGLLAAGLDKVRNDFCLNVWDVNQRISTWDRKLKGWASTRPQYDPMRKLASSETISSVKFFTDLPDTLVTGVKGQFVRIYDLRESSGNPVIQFPTRCAHSLSIDAKDENYFASASNSGEPTVCLWDRRAGLSSSVASLSSGHHAHPHSGPVLEFRNCMDRTDPSTSASIWSVRFCRSRRALGVLSNRGQLKVYETAQESAGRSDGHVYHPHSPSIQTVAGAQLLYTRRCRQLQSPYRGRHQSLAENTRIESFDFMASGRSDDEYRIIACQCNGSLQVIPLRPRPPIIQSDIKGGMSLLVPGPHVRGDGLEKVSCIDLSPSATKDATIADMLIGTRKRLAKARRERSSVEDHPSASTVPKPILSSRDARLRSLSVIGPSGHLFDIRQVLTLGTVERCRAEEGYLFNCATNIKILADDPGLQDLWRWLQAAERMSQQEGMVHGRLDLAFLGVRNIWNAELGRTHARRIASESGRGYTRDEFLDAVRATNKHHRRPSFKGVKTAYPEIRQLCLSICGWTSSSQDFEAELQRLLSDEPRASAAAWALFNGFQKRAIEIVLQGNDTERLVAMALAAFYNGTGTNRGNGRSAWSELCNEISANARDPWSRAILALVSTENWEAVIEETSLPLRDRIRVAIHHLDDERLAAFIDDLAEDCVKEGDIEGIWLTGITEEAADLFQNYIVRHGDVQTAVLVMSHGIPRYFDDDRFRHWQTTYCNNLDRYGLQVQRCRYTQQHSKKSVTRAGYPLIRPPPRQITVRCNFCDQSVVNDDDLTVTEGSVVSSSMTMTGTTAISTAAVTTSGVHAGSPLDRYRPTSDVVCPRCGRHLPRCGVCMMWLGTVESDREEVTGGGGNNHHHYNNNNNVMASNNNDVKTRPPPPHPAARFLNFCNMCHHGFHAHHARIWFGRHKMCPVAECNCLCAAYESS